MDYNIHIRKKNKGLQVVIQYKDPTTGVWKQKSKQGFEDSREGKKQAKEYGDSIVNKLKEMVSKSISKDKIDMSIKELKEEYLEHIRVHREYNTHRIYSNALKSFPLDNIKVLDLRLVHIQKCIDNLVDTASVSTIESKKTIFKCMLNYANKQYNIPTPNIANLVLPRDKFKTQKRALNVEEQKDCLEFYKNRRSLDYYLTVLISLTCGLRVGEIVGLTWDDIDFNNAILDVNKQWKINKNTKIYGFGALKSKNSYRSVPIPSITLFELNRIKKLNRTSSFNRILVTESTQQVSVNLDRNLKKHFGICIHELRHTYATNLISSGLDFKTSAMLLGHEVEQTMKTYSHVTDDMIKKATLLINNFY